MNLVLHSSVLHLSGWYFRLSFRYALLICDSEAFLAHYSLLHSVTYQYPKSCKSHVQLYTDRTG